MMPEGEAEAAGTLQAALRQAGEAGRHAELPAQRADDVLDQRAARADALVLDLWVERLGDHLRAFNGAEQARLAESGWLFEPADGAGWKFEAGAAALAAKAPTPPDTIFDDVDGDGNEDEPIPVRGQRPPRIDDDSSWGIPSGEPDSGPSGTGGGPSGGGPSNQQKEDADDTPCVDEVPAGADLDEINDLAKFMGTKLAGLQDATGWEWGAFIYRLNGQLYQSDPFTARHHDDLIGASVNLPNGAHIVGYIHTHPIDADSDQRLLSSIDRQFISTLVGMTDNITADSKLLAYVTTKDKDQGTYSDEYSAYVYDKSNRDADSSGCDL